jgi:acyl dehydratase
LIAPTLKAEALRVGDPVPPLTRSLTPVRVIAYAGATWDWHRLHFDPAYAAARNLSAPVVDGQMLGALLAEALLDWMGPRAFIRRMSFRLRAMVFAGETARCEGEVSEIAADADHEIVTVVQRVRVGDRLAADGSALVALPR